MIMIFLVAVLYFLFRFDLLSLFLLTIVSSFFTSTICSVVSALYLNGSHLFPLLFFFCTDVFHHLHIKFHSSANGESTFSSSFFSHCN
ncbi:hypothetical protein P167DRAFT_568637 [Morchella conica CCBAS932]|uniref:Uncharacterized protein n=1 Tax=Morchella conica CCBAS932 TaxID=1392247 RepID=A0A3N4KA81_9PEZI|nr:hypothetical protein P167DRAFT_568637 [Morchella conica CCBAS932]